MQNKLATLENKLNKISLKEKLKSNRKILPALT